jgi:hypothetical protein
VEVNFSKTGKHKAPTLIGGVWTGKHKAPTSPHHPPLAPTIDAISRTAYAATAYSRGKGLDVDADAGALCLPVRTRIDVDADAGALCLPVRTHALPANILKFVGIFVCFLALLMFPFTQAHADTNTHIASRTASNGRIYGQLLNGTNKNAPMAKQKVTLQVAQGNLGIDYATITTDANGAYSFSNLPTDKSTSYSVFFNYEGAQYNSTLINLASKPVQQVNLAVYEATTSLAHIAVVQATILLHPADAKNGVVPVSELIIFRNLGNRTYVGSLSATANKGMPNALRFSLPHTANNLSLSAGFNGYQSVQVNSGFATNAAVPPGDSQFSFTFDMPYTASSYDFDYMVNYPTVRLTMMIPVAIHASSDTLQSLGPATVYQQEYDIFAANALRNVDVHVQLEGLPVASLPLSGSSPSSPVNTSLLLLLVSLLAMASILCLTWFLYRSKRRLVTASAPAKKKAKLVQRKAPHSRTPDEEQSLLQALLELDKSYEAGTLKKVEYQERRAKIKAELRALLSEKVTS